MGDLEVDTRPVALGDGRYRTDVRRDWEIWGPMGGYMASLALRAAGRESPFARPASLACHYLGVADFAPVELVVTTLRGARTACSQRVEVTQEARPILEAIIWSIGSVEGLEHRWVTPPAVPGPEDLVGVEELFADRPPPYAFWDNLDHRPLDGTDDWPPPGPLDPVWRAWLRFRPTPTFADPWVDAARAVIVLDVMSWPSAQRHHAWREPPFVAPSLDLYVAFHEPAPEAPWLLADGVSPHAGQGLLGWQGRVWSPELRMVASGTGQALFRRVPHA